MKTSKLRAMAIALLLSVASVSANAQAWFQLEAGIGGSAYSDGGDGYWYQDGFEHKLRLTAPSFEVGITGDLYQTDNWGVSYHADWAWLGTIHTQSLAVPDANYNLKTKGCNGPCDPASNFLGSGHESGFLLTLEPHYDRGPWRFGVEAGPFLHKSTWTEDVSGGVLADPVHVVSTDGWRVGAVVGASITYKRASIVYQHFFLKTTGSNPAPPIWHSVDMIFAKYRF